MRKTDPARVDKPLIILGLEEALALLTSPPVVRRATRPHPVNVAALRGRIGLNQNDFAERIGVPVATLRNWEQGRRSPTGSACVLLALLDRNPGVIDETLQSDMAESGSAQLQQASMRALKLKSVRLRPFRINSVHNHKTRGGLS